MKKALILLICLVPLFSAAQKITQGEYFFDHDPGYGNGNPFSFTAGGAVEFTENISLEDVQPGYHTFYYRLKDDVHGWGQTFNQPVYKYHKPPMTKVVYTFDEDATEYVLNIEPPSSYVHDDFIIDLARLDTGMHSVSFQVENANGFRSRVWVDSVLIDHSSVPANYQLSSTTLTTGTADCYNATNTITVAGDGTNVIIESGATADFIAGQSVRFLPGFYAQAGSYAHGYITTTGDYCVEAAPAIVTQEEQVTEKEAVIVSAEEIVQPRKMVVYPNPGNGEFTVEFQNFEGEIQVMLFNSIGQMVQNKRTIEKQIRMFVSHSESGMYFLKAMNRNKQFNHKSVIK